MNNSTPVRGRVLRRVGALCVGLVAALVLTEILFRLLGVGAPTAPKALLVNEDDRSATWHCYPTNPSGDFRPVPDVSRGRWKLTRLLSPTVDAPLAALAETPWCVEYRRGSLGVRGPAVEAFPRPGVVRIAGIGDSFALGEGVPFEKTLFARLAEFLGPGVEVLNGGESGADAELNLRRLEWISSTYACPRALVIYNLNDVALTPEMRRQLDGAYDLVNLRSAQLGARSSWIQSISRVAAWFGEAAETRDVARATVSSYLDAYDPERNGANLAVLSAQFARMAHETEVRVGLVVYPMMYRLGDDCPLRPCHDQVVRMAREAGLPVLDLLPAFRGQDAGSLHVHALDHHPDGRAHEIAARAIADWIVREPSLRW